MHPWDNRALSFEGVVQIFESVRKNLVPVYEKVDGINISWRWDGKIIRFVRNKSDLEIGGAISDEFRKRFINTNLLTYIDDFIDYMTHTVAPTLEATNAPKMNYYFNSEIIIPDGKQLLEYDKSNVLIIHGPCLSSGDARLNDPHVKAMEVSLRCIQDDKWTILTREDTRIIIDSLAPDKYDKFFNINKLYVELIKKFIAENKISANDKLEKLFLKRLKLEMKREGLGSEFINDVIALHKVGNTNYVTLRKKHSHSIDAEIIRKYCLSSNKTELYNRLMGDYIKLITNWGAEILTCFGSVLVEQEELFAQKLKQKIETSIEKINLCDDSFSSVRKEKLEHQLSKIDKWTCPLIEGLVVHYPKDEPNLYKITGNYAAYNQIYGYAEFGRGEMPPV